MIFKIKNKKNDPNLFRIKVDVAKFAAERLDKEAYSTRQELTGKTGKPLLTILDQIENESG